MEYLSLEEVSKSYGEKVLFDSINLTISKGDKIALIARNGSGKSTLLRLIAGHTTAEGERAKVHINKHVKVEFLDQEPEFEGHYTIEEAFFDSDNPAIQAHKEYTQALSTDPDKLEEAMAKMDDLKAWDIEAKSQELLFRLNLTDLSQSVGTLSGGQKKRLALAFLILDEPTNHLDVEMIEWLEVFLSTASLTLLMVTHDRYFLERVCTQIIELDKGILFPYSGNYSDYLEKKALRTQQDNVSYDKAKKLLQKELEWVRRQPKARGTKAKSRVDGYHKLNDHVSSISYEEVFTIEVDSARLGKKILEFYDVSKAYGDKVLLDEFWYKFKKGERVGISGSNGTGKTTFVKILTGELRPDSGKRVQGETVQFGYYTQDGISLNEDKRIIDVIRDIAEFIPLKKGQKLSAAALLENFMFPREQQQVYVSQLSGGERKRLHLLCVLVKNPNFLILDEPTNDLDILTLNVLESYLMQFPGCLVIISHDRFFMDKLVDHMFIFKGGGEIQDYNGTYSQWKAQSKLERYQDAGAKSKKVKKEVAATPDAPRKLSYNEKKELETIEKDIAKMEKRKKEIEQQFLGGIESNDEITALSVELGDIKNTIDEKEMRWLELSEIGS